MILTQATPTIERGSSVGEELQFGIAAENMGLVLGILRSKLYSDPIAAICREVTCNARDANREAGKPDLPVRVQLPTRFDPHLRISDDGPGISPHRMRTIFVNFGSSTKRADNAQTGGFGLGAKTPFAYADQFTITTTHDGVTRTYSAFLDETQKGALVLLSEAPADGTSGTTIAIPVRPGDGSTFADRLMAACRHWPVRPSITPAVQWPLAGREIMRGVRWRVLKESPYSYDTVTILIDGIAYPASLDAIGFDRHGRKNPLFSYGTKCIYIEVPNGAIPLSANREAIHWTEAAKQSVRERLGEIGAEILRRCRADIDACDTWIDAVQCAKDLRLAFDLSSLDSWRGVKLEERAFLGADCQAYTVSSWDRERCRYIEPSWTTLVMVNDTQLAKVTLAHIKAAYAAFPMASAYARIIVTSAQPPIPVPYVKLSDLLGVKVTKPVKPARRLYHYNGGGWSLTTSDAWEADKQPRVYVTVTRERWTKRLSSPADGRLSALVGVSVYGFTAEADYSAYQREASSLEEHLATVAASNDLQTAADYLRWDAAIDRSYHAIAVEFGILDDYRDACAASRLAYHAANNLSAMGVKLPPPNSTPPVHVAVAIAAIDAILSRKPLLKYARDNETDPAWKEYIR